MMGYQAHLCFLNTRLFCSFASTYQALLYLKWSLVFATLTKNIKRILAKCNILPNGKLGAMVLRLAGLGLLGLIMLAAFGE